MICFSACANKKTALKAKYTGHFTESVQQFMVTQDKKHIVILGNKRHYVFDNSPALTAIISSPMYSHFTASFENMKGMIYQGKGKIFGKLVLGVESKAYTHKQLQTLTQLGFYDTNATKQTDDFSIKWRKDIALTGKYYQATILADRDKTSNNVLNQPIQTNKLGKEHFISITEVQATDETLSKNPVQNDDGGEVLAHLFGMPLLMLASPFLGVLYE